MVELRKMLEVAGQKKEQHGRKRGKKRGQNPEIDRKMKELSPTPPKYLNATEYLEQVKMERPQQYSSFLDIMKEFKTKHITTAEVVTRVHKLFDGNMQLIVGFNVFLPPDYKIKIPDDAINPGQITKAPAQIGPSSSVPTFSQAIKAVEHLICECAETQKWPHKKT
eukprot:Phypoly_transcript_13023.p1 GENE.Phypoly_transcript_13023~~Phypoly_transcript_13023.p1  ORF type:complete len:166 (+),score=32.15 Phypoly_transcript_13023:438-935(+)